MIADSFKFRGHACFKAGWSGIDEFKPITVIIGRNNTGKSHLIDVLSQLTGVSMFEVGLDYRASGILDKDSLRSVFRDNTKGGDLPGHVSHWDDHGRRFVNQEVEWEFSSADQSYKIVRVQGNDDAPWPDAAEARRKRLEAVVRSANTRFAGREFRRLFADRDMSPEQATQELALNPDGKGATNIIRRFILSSNPTMREELIQVDLLQALSKIFGDDGAFTQIELRHNEALENWEVFLGEPAKGLVPLSKSGSGLKTVFLVLLHLLVLPEMESKERRQYVFAFEELENNLHPALLRRLFGFLADYVEREGCMLFLTTHSSVALDFFGLRPDTQIIHVTHDGKSAATKTISAHFDQIGLLSELGARPSDLLQANGVVWLEGPSDRIYLNHFIRLYSDGTLREGRDYQCAYYGGAILAKTTFSSPEAADETFANLLRLNHNIAVICDGDRTAESGAGSRIKGRVQRIKREVEALSPAFLWITDAKEIENYIPGDVWSNVYGVDDVPDPGQYDSFPTTASENTDFLQRHLKRKSFDKCDFAMKAIEHITREEIKDRFDLDGRMKDLVESIRKWNK